MIITKYEHACFTVEHEGKLLVVDPGVFTSDLEAPENVVAIVTTHIHPDHFDKNAILALFAHNPEAVLYADETITSELDDPLPTQAVKANDTVTVGPFDLKFFGGTHATMFPGEDVTPNVGVMINEKIYFPGDSLAAPGQAVDVLALPISAPWLKVHEAIDFLNDVQPRLTFPTHDAILSQTGKDMLDNMVSSRQKNGEYRRLNDRSNCSRSADQFVDSFCKGDIFVSDAILVMRIKRDDHFVVRQQ